MTTRIPLAAAALAAVLLAGCKPGLPPTVSVSGTVTVDKVPVKSGLIVFYPHDKDGIGPVSCTITDGKYEAPTIPKGKYLVAIREGSAPPGYGEQVSSDFGTPSPKDKRKGNIPSQYSQPTLDADVTADNANLNFDLRW